MNELRTVAEYVTKKVPYKEATINNYISTVNMLPDKQGVTKIEDLPKAASVSVYKTKDVLVSNIRPYFKKIWFANKKGTCSSDVLVFRSRDVESFDSKYMYYCLHDDKFFYYMMAGAKGTKMPRGDKQAIMNYRVNVPPLPTQRKIAAILSAMDDMIENNRKTCAKLEEIAAAVFKRWFVDFEFPDAQGKPYKSSGGKMVESELGLIPEGWEVGSLKDAGSIVGGSTPSKKRDDFYIDGTIPWITPRDLSGYNSIFIGEGENSITEEAYKSCSAQMLPKGSVLYSSRAPIGYIAIASKSVCTNQGFKSIVPDKGYETEYIYEMLKWITPTIVGAAGGSTFKEISSAGMRSISLPLPEKSVAKMFSDSQIEAFKIIHNLEEQNRVLQQTRDTLLPKLISGELPTP